MLWISDDVKLYRAIHLIKVSLKTFIKHKEIAVEIYLYLWSFSNFRHNFFGKAGHDRKKWL